MAECSLDGAKGMATSGVKVGFDELEADKELAPHLTTAFRGCAVRGIALIRVNFNYKTFIYNRSMIFIMLTRKIWMYAMRVICGNKD